MMKLIASQELPNRDQELMSLSEKESQESKMLQNERFSLN